MNNLVRMDEVFDREVPQSLPEVKRVISYALLGTYGFLHIFEAPDAAAAEVALLANRFAWVKAEDRFTEGDWGTALTGAPILTEAMAWPGCTICRLARRHTHGSCGEVVAGGVPHAGAPPFVSWNRGYRRLTI